MTVGLPTEEGTSRLAHDLPTPPASWSVVPVAVDGDTGPLLGVYYPPAGAPSALGDLLLVPPFAEELNRCRSMVARQAQALATLGVGTLVLDPRGTGDSHGDFADASWEGWLADLRAGLEWLRARGRPCTTLWAIRLGAVLATQLARQDGGIERMLLWQPVLDAKQHFTQFLRIRIAAELHRPDRVKTTAELRARAAAGQPIDISGYMVGPALAQALDGQAVADDDWAGLDVDWFEVPASDDAPIPPAALRSFERMKAAGQRVTLHTAAGPAFWQLHERFMAPALLIATHSSVQAWAGSAAPGQAPSMSGHAVTTPLSAAPERPLVFPCGQDRLFGVLHQPPHPARCGVIIVVAGGPQYRAGAHRQWVSMARRQVAQGCAALRFDLRGMGDSTGTHHGFLDSGPDIRAAIDALMSAQPQLEDIVLLGECNSASAILFHAWLDRRVTGVVLVNPWVRTPESQAQVIVKDYYLDRLRSREFWAHVASGKFDWRGSLRSLREVLATYWRGRRQMRQSGGADDDALDHLPLPVRTAEGLRRFNGPALLMMSGRDYIAREFDEVIRLTPAWHGLIAPPRIERRDFDGVDHTFSRAEWKAAAADAVANWLQRKFGTAGPAAPG